MARRPAGDGPNKSVAIRSYKDKNPDAGPKAIAAALAEDGVVVTPAFVSTVLSNAKRKTGKPGRRGRKPGPAAASTGSVAGSSMESLIQAKKLADQMGGIAQAKAALDVLAKLFA